MAVLIGALPWGWFMARDAYVGFDLVAMVVPAVFAGSAIVVAAAAIASKRAIGALVAVSLLAASALATVGPWRPRGGGWPVDASAVTVAVANVLADSRPPDPVAASILARNADVSVLLESQQWIEKRFRTVYPYGLGTDLVGGDVAVFSRVPLVRHERLPGDLAPYGLRIVAGGPAGPFALYALHLPKPALSSGKLRVPVSQQRRLLEHLRDVVREDALPTVVAGDLNLSDRTEGYRIMDGVFIDAARAHSWAGPTSRRALVGLLALRIDHIFVTRAWCARGLGRFDVAGSDHFGIESQVGPCRE